MIPNEASSASGRRLTVAIFMIAALFAAALFFFSPVHAQSLDAAKAAGHVVEQANGLAAACPGAPASASGTVQAVNAKRLRQYQDIAASTGATLAQVQARAGAKLLQSSPGGCK